MPSRYYLDTNVVISIIEATETFGQAQRRFVEKIDAREIAATTSELTLAECLVKPLANKDAAAVEAYLHFLDGRPGFLVVPISRDILLAAASLRADKTLKLPDAIHIATARAAGCTAFLTNDRKIRALPGMRVSLWDEATMSTP
ncbi:MAG: type II toxin-antitoxin system VapC family toxin [Pseudomonadota bacterium]|nr:type II toxin-antitoxin system VapC family toxin [Pseudomonadota bacterium]